MSRFGMKNKKIAQFGAKAMKSGTMGLKNAGRKAYNAGTTVFSPALMSEMRSNRLKKLRQGVEKMRNR
tara:strand:+ start:40 stop:243 length:204 start_codon:yes stop_codon:yes gene_type:complete